MPTTDRPSGAVRIATGTRKLLMFSGTEINWGRKSENLKLDVSGIISFIIDIAIHIADLKSECPAKAPG